MRNIRPSARALRLRLLAYGLPLLLVWLLISVAGLRSRGASSVPVILGLLVFLCLFPLAAFIYYATFRLLIDDRKVEVTRSFISRSSTTLEFDKIEGVEIHQGVWGRSYDYGYLTLSGTGGKRIKTEPLDGPQQVAETIRQLIRPEQVAVVSSPALDTPVPSLTRMKQCPFCAEEIRSEAIKCKHCGEMLNT